MLQLIYMWIENFRTLKNANLNFHANFEFEFEPTKTEEIKHPNGKKEESVKEGKLKIKKFKPNDDFIYKYFQNEKKDNKNQQFISLIVGKNGTGKTSVLDAIAGDYQYTYSEGYSYLKVVKISRNILKTIANAYLNAFRIL